MTRRVERFVEEFKNVNLEEFYQLPNKKSEIVRINFRGVSDRAIKIFIYYEKAYACPDLDLPTDLMEHIKGYLPDIVQIELTLTIPESQYPFRPHMWEVIRVKSNIFDSSKYLEIINRHNMYNIADWSPAITIQSDVLCLIEKLYDYLYAAENKFIIKYININITKLTIHNESII